MTMFGLRKGSGQVRTNTGVLGGYRNPPGAIWAIVGLSGKEKRQPNMGRAPLPSLGPNRTRRGGRPLSLFPPSANPIPTRIGGGGGNPTPRESRTLLERLLWPASLPPSSPLYTEAEAPQKHTS